MPSWKQPPSPMSAIVVNFLFARCAPVASAIALPCSPLNPYVDIVSAPFPLHPMSNDMKDSDGEMFNSMRAFFRAVCMAKLPHPGHHVG